MPKPIYLITTGQMVEPLPTMCNECPLAKTSKPGNLGGYDVASYLGLLHGPASIACHMSRGFPKGLDGLEQQRHCTGVAHYRANAWGKYAINAVGSAVGAILKVGPSDEAFGSPKEFMKHHEG